MSRPPRIIVLSFAILQHVPSKFNYHWRHTCYLNALKGGITPGSFSYLLGLLATAVVCMFNRKHVVRYPYWWRRAGVTSKHAAVCKQTDNGKGWGFRSKTRWSTKKLVKWIEELRCLVFDWQDNSLVLWNHCSESLFSIPWKLLDLSDEVCVNPPGLPSLKPWVCPELLFPFI